MGTMSAALRDRLTGWRESADDLRTAPRWNVRTGTWQLSDGRDPAGLPVRWRATPGRWWRRCRPMHGVYHRPAADPQLPDQLDGMAVLNGWRCGFWRGPAAMAAWRSPLISYWNPILAQGSGRLNLTSSLDWDQYTADAVLGGFKPYGYLLCTAEQDKQLAARAAAAPFGVAVSDYDPDPHVEGSGWVTLARTEPLDELVPDIGGLLRAYHAALPAELFEEEALPLGSVTDWRPADFLDDFEVIERGPSAILGLILGYPPLVTAGALLRRVPAWWMECGSLPPRHWTGAYLDPEDTEPTTEPR